ncbi:LysR family transcriptional regulator [Streptomyces cinereoruber]|uniref:LysR family transcriptional regulator n=1 Tax=Streptomyces cinereoruber TaxID=67260 RepID=A0AAV4KQF7_9ACTN|nr:LysR family transcriptional regulator [Streptomyces cinereoruber]MBB4161760.1 DNA-binding transcriptional LysR family regulator [Streptomyces cinereoruber]MBY8820072.1 LysR family transcriptional regulator [Streptomyces cinereoruber]NIH65445.1 DNA-binding transcriptional LysR family regulator [Streptomyces cinereoruber]QEV30837.1 LysR family transcriptional regulator [Streptomyces cinereoruber]GGR47742.1 LysR family transcriptional regulator [Streptomyces cinereoruber]
MNDFGQDLELRLVRYFTVVAAHQHFGRAAADLHVAQPALSRQVQRLEKYLGARLLDRTPQGTRLTPAGQTFLPRAQALLQAARQAELAVREQARTERIIIGYVEDLVITPVVRELRRRHPDAEITTRYLSCRDVGALPEKHVDALIARAPLPFATEDVVTTPLYEEPRMLVVPRDHPLADRASVTAEELSGEEAAPCAFETADWASYRILGTGVPLIESYEDKLELVASGRVVAVLPIGDRRSSLRPGLVTVPIKGAPPSQVVLVSRRGDSNPMVWDLRPAAEAVLTAPPACPGQGRATTAGVSTAAPNEAGAAEREC